MMGVLHFFVPVNLPAPINNIGEDAGDYAGYDIEIDAISVSPFTFYTKFF